MYKTAEQKVKTPHGIGKEYHHSQVQYKQHVLSLNHKRMNETKKYTMEKKIDEP